MMAHPKYVINVRCHHTSPGRPHNVQVKSLIYLYAGPDRGVLLWKL